MAPQVLDQEKGGYCQKADMWSIGITAIEIAEGMVPNGDETEINIMMNILNKDPPELCRYEGWSKEFQAFVKDCLQYDPNVRIHSRDIFTKHKKFFSKSLGSWYIYDKLLKDIPLLKDRIPDNI